MTATGVCRRVRQRVTFDASRIVSDRRVAHCFSRVSRGGAGLRTRRTICFVRSFGGLAFHAVVGTALVMRERSEETVSDATEGSMNEWWSDLDDDLLATLGAGGAMTPAELGERLGISEPATASLLAMLVTEGRVRIRLVERTS